MWLWPWLAPCPCVSQEGFWVQGQVLAVLGWLLGLEIVDGGCWESGGGAKEVLSKHLGQVNRKENLWVDEVKELLTILEYVFCDFWGYETTACIHKMLLCGKLLIWLAKSVFQLEHILSSGNPKSKSQTFWAQRWCHKWKTPHLEIVFHFQNYSKDYVKLHPGHVYKVTWSTNEFCVQTWVSSSIYYYYLCTSIPPQKKFQLPNTSDPKRFG
jgi:hypothetical protein